MKACISSYLAGLLFGAGLIVSGMIDPANVLGFFDLAGQWNPTLAFVMGGGLAVTFLGYRLGLKRPKPVCAEDFSLPSSSTIDGRLLGGAALFGLGWGLAGYCPGPALAATAAGFGEAAVFTVGMVGGLLLWRMVEVRKSQAA